MKHAIRHSIHFVEHYEADDVAQRSGGAAR
jgi:hypothetical protein